MAVNSILHQSERLLVTDKLMDAIQRVDRSTMYGPIKATLVSADDEVPLYVYYNHQHVRDTDTIMNELKERFNRENGEWRKITTVFFMTETEVRETIDKEFAQL